MSAQPDDDKSISHQIERSKANLDYAKQLTTLSTGSIVLVAAFIEKGFPNPSWKPLIAVSLVGFVISVVGSVVAHTLMLLDFAPRRSEAGEWESILGGLSLVMAWGGFLAGIVTLSTFAARNLL